MKYQPEEALYQAIRSELLCIGYDDADWTFIQERFAYNPWTKVWKAEATHYRSTPLPEGFDERARQKVDTYHQEAIKHASNVVFSTCDELERRKRVAVQYVIVPVNWYKIVKYLMSGFDAEVHCSGSAFFSMVIGEESLAWIKGLE